MPRFTEERRTTFIESLREGCWRATGARAAGVHFSTVRRHMLADPDFAAAVEDAELDANTAVENALYQRVLDGNVTACLAWLYSRMPERWRDMRNTSVSVNTEVQPPAPELSPEQRDKVLALVQELRGTA